MIVLKQVFKLWYGTMLINFETDGSFHNNVLIEFLDFRFSYHYYRT